MGIVDLQDEAGGDDRLVFLAQGIGEREQIFLLGAVVAVALPVRRAGRRDRRHEDLGRLGAGERRLEIGDVGGELPVAAVGDRRGADHVPLARRRVASRRRTRETSGPRAARPRAGARNRIGLEAAEALVDVGHEARLAELAVVDHVDSELDLPAHDLGHGRGERGGVRPLVDRPALLPGLHRREQVGRPRQAADMGGENSLAAGFHVAPDAVRSGALVAWIGLSYQAVDPGGDGSRQACDGALQVLQVEHDVSLSPRLRRGHRIPLILVGERRA